MSRRPWYKRYPADAITGMLMLSLEEKGAYSTVIDLIYLHGGPIEDDARYLSHCCGCSVRKWTALRDRLIDLGKLYLTADGRLSNRRADREIKLRGRRQSSAGWKILRQIVFRRDKFTCQYCGQKSDHLECDHIVPVARGGIDALSNLTTACRPCNRSKSSKMLGEWRAHG